MTAEQLGIAVNDMTEELGNETRKQAAKEMNSSTETRLVSIYSSHVRIMCLCLQINLGLCVPESNLQPDSSLTFKTVRLANIPHDWDK